MLRLFRSTIVADPQLGELRRRCGKWRGTIALSDAPHVPLAIAGSRAKPDVDALDVAYTLAARYPLWQPQIAAELFSQHYAPHAEAVAAGELEHLGSKLPEIDDPAGVWPHVQPVFVAVGPLFGELMVEIGYQVAWDDEHTLGARLRDGQLVELNGSVLPP